ERRGDEDARLLHARPDHQEVLPTGLRHRPNTLQGRRAELRPGQGGGHQEEVGDGGWRRPAVRRARGVHRGDPRGAAALQGLHRLAAPAAQGCHHGPGREGPRGRHGAEDPRQLQGLGRRGPRARAPADGEGDLHRHVHVHGDRRRGEERLLIRRLCCAEAGTCTSSKGRKAAERMVLAMIRERTKLNATDRRDRRRRSSSCSASAGRRRDRDRSRARRRRRRASRRAAVLRSGAPRPPPPPQARAPPQRVRRRRPPRRTAGCSPRASQPRAGRRSRPSRRTEPSFAEGAPLEADAATPATTPKAPPPEPWVLQAKVRNSADCDGLDGLGPPPPASTRRASPEPRRDLDQVGAAPISKSGTPAPAPKPSRAPPPKSRSSAAPAVDSLLDRFAELSKPRRDRSPSREWEPPWRVGASAASG
ncbi:unnamed protein product, partial [Prorocentrum cordatum]